MSINSNNLMEEPEVVKQKRKDIFLFDTYIAGSNYIDNIEELVSKFEEGEVFNFYREPDNKYDGEAFIIKNKDHEKIGYVPMVDNAVFSRLLDSGKYLFGVLKDIEVKGKWHKININIYLKD